jgi:hypothetical protein
MWCGNFLLYAVFTWAINIQALDCPMLQVEEAEVYCMALIVLASQSAFGSSGSQEQYSVLSVVVCGMV